ncbi:MULTISPECIES: DUF6988 family protein [Cupriavidus]|jgi:hypothetical protein|uniref:Uncharacterized protein n=1 Tax=Cupriavidus metallidurans TaxID=119219 RepID=A0A482ILV5_9BURK|nr:MULTISPECIES: hypothetical protein [Cupriavidus]KWR83519.1 hypothetical protein RN01_09160 [Cupriavidus sp. SHE]QBP08677.1 hypothetical protein DDF84_002430 [Cupriavidus metallidurans]QWC89098.1 hypothetical protein KB891_02525 [Cupriavidus metallidurans]
MTEEKLLIAIDRTAQLHEAVAAHVDGLIPFPEKRFVVSFQAGLLSLDHARGALILIGNRLGTSALSLLRPQYESLVRGIWLLHAATDNWVDKLGEPLTVESARRANEGPMLAEMLKQLDASDAPAHLIDQLKQFKDVSWKALSSYTHGGLHPLARTLSGFPVQLAIDAMRNSNALVCIAAQLTAILTGDPQRNMPAVRKLHVDFADCTPIIKPHVEA